MSLDVYLKNKSKPACDCCGRVEEDGETLYWANITHNLGKMAGKAGIYDCLWRPEENGIEKAWDLIPPLQAGLGKLKSDPTYYRSFDSPNGWGLYDHFVPFVEDYLQACKENPDAIVVASR
jgi:hypothetical protein